MQNKYKALPVLFCLFSAQAAFSQDDDAAFGLKQYISDFTYDFSVRYRHETVSQDNASEDARASTAIR